ncbi:MAG: mechanosensitive ion channel [Candidatus Ancaeobacter aquaticus]|nr:mechanosensitive ion channel [Candidatus Ancaeobacter aquaticus]
MKKGSFLIFLVAVGLLFLSGSALSENNETETVKKEHEVAHHTITEEAAILKFYNHAVATFREPSRGFTPKQRAIIAHKRIYDIHKHDRNVEVRAVRAKIGDVKGYIVLYNNRIVFALTKGDVDPLSGKNLDKIAKETADTLRETITAENKQRELPVLLKDIGFALLSLLILIVISIVLSKIRNRIFRKYEKVPTHVKKFIVSGVDLRAVATTCEKNMFIFVFFAAWATLVYFWLSFVFSLFHYTQPWSQKLDHYLFTTLVHILKSFLDALPQLALVFVIFVIARLINKFISGILRKVEEGKIAIPWLDEEAAKASRRILTVILWIFAFIVAYPHIPGSGTGVFKGISVFLGLMISLGSTGLVNQIMCGLVVVWSRAIKPGEYIRVADVQGVVKELGVLSTKIKTAYKQEITIPNAVLISGNIINYTRLSEFEGAVPTVSVSIGYDVPWRQVQILLKKAAENTTGVRKDPPAKIVKQNLNDFYIQYDVFVHIDKGQNIPIVMSNLNGNILDAFNDEGIQVMSPHFNRQPEGKVIVPKDKWYPNASEKDKA